jgi:hypothetical protein
MSDQPYAVFDAEGKAVAAFSTEDLAMTHAAKLRAIPVTHGPVRIKPLYHVGPLMLDADAALELEHAATLDVPRSRLGKHADEEVLISVTRLASELDLDSIDLYEWPTMGDASQEETWITFTAYGWSPDAAAFKLQAMILAELANPSDLGEDDD